MQLSVLVLCKKKTNKQPQTNKEKKASKLQFLSELAAIELEKFQAHHRLEQLKRKSKHTNTGQLAWNNVKPFQSLGLEDTAGELQAYRSPSARQEEQVKKMAGKKITIKQNKRCEEPLELENFREVKQMDKLLIISNEKLISCFSALSLVLNYVKHS